MVHEGADDIRIAKIHAQSNAGIFQGSTVVIGNIHSVAEKGLIHRSTHIVEQQKMELVDVEGVQFIRTILDDPIFHSALLHNDVGDTRIRIKRLRCLTINGDIKLCRACRIVWIG